VVDELWSDGAMRATSQRLWPQTERLKAEILRPDAKETRVLEAYGVLDRYIAPAPPGLWLERRGADGSFPRDPAPASSLYHLTTAIILAHQALSERPKA
jgi:mannose/cellobiose epimerase-like protein (N-acyl-D-glucosamine 2-epimerase family)